MFVRYGICMYTPTLLLLRVPCRVLGSMVETVRIGTWLLTGVGSNKKNKKRTHQDPNHKRLCCP